MYTLTWQMLKRICDTTDLQYSRESNILSCFDKSIPINLHCTDCVEDEKYEADNIWFYKYCIAKKQKCWGIVKTTIICVTMYLKKVPMLISKRVLNEFKI